MRLLGGAVEKLSHRTSVGAVVDRMHYYLARAMGETFWKCELLLRGVRPLSSIRSLTVIGRPIITMGLGSSIQLGGDVFLMSSSRFCLSTSLYAPCKIRTICRSARIEIGDGASFNGTSMVCRSSRISIGARTMIGPNVTILDSPFHPMWPLDLRNYYAGTELDQPVEIGEEVWIGAHVMILPGSTIGSGSVIGAGSIVKGMIPPNCLAAGAPARVIRRLDLEGSR